MVDRKHTDTVREHTISCRPAGLAQALRREAIPHLVKLSDTGAEHYAPPPLLGAGTDDVLRDLAKLAPADIAALRAGGVVG